MAVITISRQYGSGGDEIANQVCSILGYQYFNKYLLAQVASEVGLLEQEVVDFSEDTHEVRGFLDRLLSGPRVVVSQAQYWQEGSNDIAGVNVVKLDESQCIKMVQIIIDAAYERGNIVIIGRGGQAILKKKPGVLHVRIEAPMGARVRRVQEQDKVNLKTAREIVTKRDNAAIDYLKRFYDVDGSNPMLYHMVINTGKWELKTAAHLIVDGVNYLPSVESSN